MDAIKDKIALEVYGNIRNDKPGYIEAFRIPDMFKITFRFKSLIPSNFNTYMMSFTETPVLIDTPENGGHFDTIYQDLGTSLAGIVLDRIEKAMGGTKENPSEEQETGTGSSRENPEGGSGS